MRTQISISALCVLLIANMIFGQEAAEEAVSYYKHIRPILQAHCQGCHQPAKQSGEYVMTDFARLVAGGESGTAAIVPGQLEESYLIELITPVDGEAMMPKEKSPLSQAEIDLIRRWISQGAADDTPKNAQQRYDLEHPPVYSSPPIVTSLAYSPDGSLLAVAGFHEVLLHKADGSGLVARLVGLSERIESIAFSPDGTRLAVTGGLPERMGELQVWEQSSVQSPESSVQNPESRVQSPESSETTSSDARESTADSTLDSQHRTLNTGHSTLDTRALRPVDVRHAVWRQLVAGRLDHRRRRHRQHRPRAQCPDW